MSDSDDDKCDNCEGTGKMTNFYYQGPSEDQEACREASKETGESRDCDCHSTCPKCTGRGNFGGHA